MKSFPQARSFGAALVFAFIMVCILVLSGTSAFAQSANGPVIFDVRRSLPLEPDEPVTKDFYINVGPESGLKKGVYINVVRAVPVHDPIKNQQQATLNIPVGKVQVIDVQRGITVARLQSELGDDERPTLEFEGVMIGDHVDLGSATMDVPKKPKAKAKHQTAQAAVVTEEVAVTLIPQAVPADTTQYATSTTSTNNAYAAAAAANAGQPAPASVVAPTTSLPPVNNGVSQSAKPVSAPANTQSPAAKGASTAPNQPTAVKTSQPPQSADATESEESASEA